MIALRGSACTTGAERMVMWWPVLTDSLKAAVNVMRPREERCWRPLLWNRGDTLGKPFEESSLGWGRKRCDLLLVPLFSLKGKKKDNLSPARKSELPAWVVATEYLYSAWFSLSNLVFWHTQTDTNVFTVFHCAIILKTDNAGCLNKSVTNLNAQAWNQPEGRTSEKYPENIVSKFFKNCLVSKLSLQTASHSLSSSLQAFLFLLYPPSFSRVE